MGRGFPVPKGIDFQRKIAMAAITYWDQSLELSYLIKQNLYHWDGTRNLSPRSRTPLSDKGMCILVNIIAETFYIILIIEPTP